VKNARAEAEADAASAAAVAGATGTKTGTASAQSHTRPGKPGLSFWINDLRLTICDWGPFEGREAPQASGLQASLLHAAPQRRGLQHPVLVGECAEGRARLVV